MTNLNTTKEMDNKNNQIIIYSREEGQPKIEVRLEGETVWLTQAQIAELFDTSRPNVTMHIKNIFDEDELGEKSVCQDFLHTASDGKKYSTKYYNLDFAERQAEREIPMKMTDWAKHLDGILTATGEQLLQNAGSISHKKALDKVKTEYKKFQAKTLSPVEKAYLDTLRELQKKAEKKVKNRPSKSKK